MEWTMEINLYTPGSAARFFQEYPIAALDLLEAAKTMVGYFPNPLHPARVQAQAAIDLVDLRHTPRRAEVSA
jgi:hypothetical protein